MTTPPTALDEQAAVADLAGLPPRGGPLGFLRSDVLRRPAMIVGLAILAFFVFLAIFGPWIEPYDPNTQTGAVYEPPSSAHWLGTDDAGADMLSLVIEGARVSMIVGFAAALVAMLIGGTIGLWSGFYGGKSDTVLMRITDYVLVIPDIPLMIIVAALFGRSLTNIILIIGIIYWTSTARLIRAQTKSVRERIYVKRARALGAGNQRLIGKHVLPQVMPLLIANTVITVAIAIFAETYITFLGLGDPELTSWGKLIQNAFTGDAVLNNAWWAIVPPGVCVTLVILACTMVGRRGRTHSIRACASGTSRCAASGSGR